MYRRAWPNVVPDPHQLVRKFGTVLNKGAVKREVRRRDPDTYEEALEIALREEAVWENTSVIARRSADAMDINAMDFDAYLDDYDDSDSKFSGMKAMEEAINNLSGPENAKCYTCGKPGHIARDCYRRPGASAPPKTGGFRPIGFRPNSSAAGTTLGARARPAAPQFGKKGEPSKPLSQTARWQGRQTAKRAFMAEINDLVKQVTLINEEDAKEGVEEGEEYDLFKEEKKGDGEEKDF
jgi:hypothetical protein